MKRLRAMLVDLKNGLPPRYLADQLHARGIVYVHVPKCAGTSVETAIRKNYRISRTIIDPNTSFTAAENALGLNADDATRHDVLMHASEIRRDLLHYQLTQGYKCITGHAPLGAHTLQRWQATHDFVTLLRDPVERYLSHLAFNLAGNGGHGAIGEPLEKFLSRPRAKIMGALYTKYFAGLPMNADLSSKEAIAAAKETLSRMSVVGFLDQLDEFATDVTCLTGHKISIGHNNKTNTTRKNDLDISTDGLNLIKELCTPDIEIFQWAWGKFA